VRNACLIGACVALACSASAGEARPPTTQAVLSRIEARMAEVRTIRARFRQVKRVPLFAKEI
jgi:hypothetical protein